MDPPPVVRPIREVLDRKERTLSGPTPEDVDQLNDDDDDLEMDPDSVLEGIPISHYKTLAMSAHAEYALRSTDLDQMPKAGSPEANYACLLRLRRVIRLIESDRIEKDRLIDNLRYTVQTLEASYIEQTKQLTEDEDVLSEVAPDSVPDEVRDWLATTFTRNSINQKARENKPRFRQVANAIRAGIVVERSDSPTYQ
ncbi:hypothetical protein Ciccas_012694 [Cichlidogyrus casuarinus]|uniref:PDE1 N-terminal domain-containing protein n=1 Tax=Cichlidogyrus casuarinus TaxID=1844966 RepID=A0ABD2PNC6_9PLAT